MDSSKNGGLISAFVYRVAMNLSLLRRRTRMKVVAAVATRAALAHVLVTTGTPGQSPVAGGGGMKISAALDLLAWQTLPATLR